MAIFKYCSDIEDLLSIKDKGVSISKIETYFSKINKEDKMNCPDLKNIGCFLDLKLKNSISDFQCHKKIDEIINPF